MAAQQNDLRPARAMILAAGRGERLRPYSDRLPKALMQVHGKPLLEHLLTALAAAGVEQAVVNLSWLGEMVRSAFGDGRRFGLCIRYSDEGDQALETGGGIRKALPLLGSGPFWVVNADVRTDFSFAGSGFRPADLAWLMLVANPPHNPGGDFGLRGSRVINTGPRYTFAGISVLSPELFEGVTEERFGIAPLLRKAAGADRVSGSLYDGYWADAGTVERLEAIRSRTLQARES